MFFMANLKEHLFCAAGLLQQEECDDQLVNKEKTDNSWTEIVTDVLLPCLLALIGVSISLAALVVAISDAVQS